MYAALFALTAAFRFLALKNGFVNDHFVYISGGRQMLFGDWPTRDWIDPGLPLMFAASAFAQKVFGSTLFAEAMLVSIAFGLGAAFTAAAVRRLTGSIRLAVFAALVEVAVVPRTYSYPKIVAYAFEFWLYGRYVAKPTSMRLLAMAAGVAVAFMFRHDHGLFLAVGAAATIMMVRPAMEWRITARDLALFGSTVVVLLLPYLVYVQVYGGLWLYLRNGVEFSQREASREWHVWPRVFGDQRPLESAMVYQLYVVPIIALVVLAAARLRQAAAWVVPVALVGLIVDFSFIRDPLRTRLADAIVPAVVVGSWLLARAFAPSRVRLVQIPLALAFTGLMGASVLTVGTTQQEIDRAGLLGRLQEIPGRFRERTTDLRNRFVDYQMPTRASRVLVPFFQYVDRCTSADDRLLIGGFLVEVPFYTQRLFAGGQEYFGAYFTSAANEQFAFDRLRQQHVPFFLLPADQINDFDKDFPLVGAWVKDHYLHLAEVPLTDDESVHIFVTREGASGRDHETGWPCFR